MSSVTCRYCGLPFKVRQVEPEKEYFCCTGCAVMARVPRDAQGNFPVNAHLVAALGVGFVFFNQLLAWGVAHLLRRDGKLELAMRFEWMEVAAALAVWTGVIWVQRREGVMRGKDLAFGAICLSLLLAGALGQPLRGGVIAAGNAVWLLWSFRGLLKKRLK